MTSKPMIFSAPTVRAILAGNKTQTRRVIKVQPDLLYRAPPPPPCPYPVGTQVWVREVWWWNGEAKTHESCEYRANGEMPSHMAETKWRSPIFMPRWASRLTLEITGVKVERVQDITANDALAEGSFIGECPCVAGKPKRDIHGERYDLLWDSINGKKHPWASNPWVWCYEFQRVLRVTDHADR